MSEQSMGSICWFDIPVTDIEKAKAFYKELFPWTFARMGPGYEMITAPSGTIGAFRLEEKVDQGSGTVIYLTVESVDASSEKAKALGANLMGAKVVISEDDGVFQLFQDADKNVLAFWSQK